MIIPKTCTTCRYYNLPTATLPCKQCIRCTRDGVDCWALPINDISDPSEKLDALCELQIYTMLAMVELRETVNSLVEELKERR